MTSASAFCATGRLPAARSKLLAIRPAHFLCAARRRAASRCRATGFTTEAPVRARRARGNAVPRQVFSRFNQRRRFGNRRSLNQGASGSGAGGSVASFRSDARFLFLSRRRCFRRSRAMRLLAASGVGCRERWATGATNAPPACAGRGLVWFGSIMRLDETHAASGRRSAGWVAAKGPLAARMIAHARESRMMQRPFGYGAVSPDELCERGRDGCAIGCCRARAVAARTNETRASTRPRELDPRRSTGSGSRRNPRSGIGVAASRALRSP
ncbi:MAG: hypothetical protein QOG51_63 [Verrucomicrobiota bacterium]